MNLNKIIIFKLEIKKNKANLWIKTAKIASIMDMILIVIYIKLIIYNLFKTLLMLIILMKIII